MTKCQWKYFIKYDLLILYLFLFLKKFCSLTPLALACGVLGETGPELVELLLKHNADPNEAADIGREYLSMIEEDWVGEPAPDVYFSKIDNL